MKFQWVKMLLDNSFESSWKDIIKLRYHIFNQNVIFNYLSTSDIDNITMKDIFWTDLLIFFFELKSKEKIPLNADSIIWYNSSLTRGSQEPVIAHLVFNLISKVDRKWGCYT